MIKNSNGWEALALARSTTMAPLCAAPEMLAGNVLHPKLTTEDGPEVRHLFTAWAENEAILRRRGGDIREWKDTKLFDPYKDERSFVTYVPEPVSRSRGALSCGHETGRGPG